MGPFSYKRFGEKNINYKLNIEFISIKKLNATYYDKNWKKIINLKRYINEDADLTIPVYDKGSDIMNVENYENKVANYNIDKQKIIIFNKKKQ